MMNILNHIYNIRTSTRVRPLLLKTIMDLLKYLIKDEARHKEYMEFCTSKSQELLDREDIKSM